jgi:pSer/pThr/pTyr-binding forkhead associated (FHA) protein
MSTGTPPPAKPPPARRARGSSRQRGRSELRSVTKLIVEAGPAAGAVIPFTGELRLGRAEIGGELGGDPALSRRHAVLREDPPGRTMIEDLGSVNGTYVNGQRIRGIRFVQVGDTVQVGDSKLRLAADAEHGER